MLLQVILFLSFKIFIDRYKGNNREEVIMKAYEDIKT
jgi:hypothetical protein